MRWLQAILPKEERFFTLFAEHAAAVVSGAESLRSGLSEHEGLTQKLKVVMDCEHEGDRITREVLLAVRRSFITPFDRGDITRLIQSMDDAIDQMQKTAKSILLFNVTRFEPEMVQMAECIARPAHLIQQAIPLLNSINKNVGELNHLTEQIVQVESEADDIYDAARKRLFRRARRPRRWSSGSQWKSLITWRRSPTALMTWRMKSIASSPSTSEAARWMWSSSNP
ncbi:MAG: nuclease [Microvirga sp.]|nr:nuclease [Microvirga sp.]